jgi:hypothetical protein
MPDGASQSQIRMAAVLESTPGTTPASPAYVQFPLAEGSSLLSVVKNPSLSRLIRPDREPGANVGGVSGVNGSFQMEMVREAGFDLWLESAFSAVFAFVNGSVASCTFDGTNKKLVRGAGSWLTDAIGARPRVGDAVYVTGSAGNVTTLSAAITTTTQSTIACTSIAMFNAGGGIAVIDHANGSKEFVRYTAAGGGNLTGVTRGLGGTTAVTHLISATIVPVRVITSLTATDMVFANDTVVTDATPFTAVFTTNTRILIPGTTRRRFTVEQKFSDVNIYEIYKGVEVNTMNFNLPTEGVITNEVGLLGLRYALGQVGSSSYSLLAGRTPMGASVPGSVVYVNGSAPSGCIETFSFNVNNNRAIKNGVGESTGCFIEEGRREIELSLGVYLVDTTLQTAYQAETRIALEHLAVSSDGDKLRFNFPKVFLTNGPKGISGVSVTENYTGRTEYDSVTGTSFYLHQIIAI